MQSDSSQSQSIDLEPLINPKENVYFAVTVLVSAFIYIYLLVAGLGGGKDGLAGLFWLAMWILAFRIFSWVHLGHIRGNGIRVSDRQFPEVYAMAQRHSRRLGLTDIPAIYVLQSGGVLNAFATRFLGRNFVVLYSDVLALATQKGEKAVSFVLAHELGHVRRKHMTRRAWVAPAMAIPFLGSAYSRACEYTCDRFGSACEPEGSADGILVLAAGRSLYHQVNAGEFSRQRETERGFFVRAAEMLSSHPILPKRLAAIDAGRETEKLTSLAPSTEIASAG